MEVVNHNINFFWHIWMLVLLIVHHHSQRINVCHVWHWTPIPFNILSNAPCLYYCCDNWFECAIMVPLERPHLYLSVMYKGSQTHTVVDLSLIGFVEAIWFSTCNNKNTCCIYKIVNHNSVIYLAQWIKGSNIAVSQLIIPKT